MNRLEATYEIREDIADVLARVGSYTDDNDKVRFAGWARMALPMRSFKVSEVRGMDEDQGRGLREGESIMLSLLISLPFFYDLIPLVLSCGMRENGLFLNSFLGPILLLLRCYQVRKPDVGESKPAAVTAEVVVDTRPLRGDVRGEWDQVWGRWAAGSSYLLDRLHWPCMSSWNSLPPHCLVWS